MLKSSGHTFPRSESLKSKKISDRVFLEGARVKSWPLVIRYLDVPLPEAVPCQVMVTVGKRSFKRAVDRNRIKRLMRESWRFQKEPFLLLLKKDEIQRAIVLSFVGQEMPTFETMSQNMAHLIQKMTAKLNSQSNNPTD